MIFDPHPQTWPIGHIIILPNECLLIFSAKASSLCPSEAGPSAQRLRPDGVEAGGRREVLLVLEADEVAIASTHSLLTASLSLSVTLARKLQSRGQRQRHGFEHP